MNGSKNNSKTLNKRPSLSRVSSLTREAALGMVDFAASVFHRTGNALHAFSTSSPDDWYSWFNPFSIFQKTYSSVAGTYLYPDTAQRIAAVYACIKIWSDTLSSLSIDLFYENDRNKLDLKPAYDHPLYKLFRYEPSKGLSITNWLSLYAVHICTYGNFICYVSRDPDGEILALTPLPPNQVEIVSETNEGILKYNPAARRYRFYDGSGKQHEFAHWEIFHVIGMSLDNGITGVSPIEANRDLVATNKSALDYSAQYLRNASAPSGIIEVPGKMEVSDKRDMVKSWQQKMTSDAGRHSIAVLDMGMKYEKISISPEDAQLLDTMKATNAMIASMYRVPPSMIVAIDNAPAAAYSWSEQNLRQASLPWLRNMELAIITQLLPREEWGDIKFKFNFEGLLRADTDTRMRAHHIGLQNGIFSIAEVRHIENLPFVEGTDVLRPQANLVPIGGNVEIGSQTDDVESNNPDEVGGRRIDMSESYTVSQTIG